MDFIDTGMIVCIVICAIVSLILFFPFTVWVDAEADMTGIKASVKIFRKKLLKINKKFGKDDSDDEDEDDLSEMNGLEHSADKDSEKKDEDKPDSKPEVFEAKDEKVSGFGEDESEENGKKKKRSLTSRQSWTILLTPEFDAQAWWAVKCLFHRFLKLFNVKFYNCFVEGIRLDYAKMGQLASLNAILQSYPYIGAWDFRMDWTGTVEPHGEGHVRIRFNICRIIGIIIAFLFYGGITAFRYWRRRANVLKTNELPELGWIRSKIVNILADDKEEKDD